ncbi:MAG: AAA family ATPase, partial [Calditrichaeota bacterium]|nr:AAA family ATPase [Calditrichota bacterium]
GKTQLARAAAKALGWAFVSCTIDARSDAADLLYQLDAVTRLGEAQITAALKKDDEREVRELLAEKRFIQPGPVWWAFSWESALEQAELVGVKPPPQLDQGKPEAGCVLLIDEIDKADADLPNGLLEAFGSGRFQPPGVDNPVTRSDRPLLMVITTNEERALPDAFLRRCLVLHLNFPEGEALEAFFIDRGKAHFSEVTRVVLENAARQVRADREHWQQLNLAAPGLAEYLDLIRAVTRQESDEKDQLKLLERINHFMLRKHPEA